MKTKNIVHAVACLGFLLPSLLVAGGVANIIPLAHITMPIFIVAGLLAVVIVPIALLLLIGMFLLPMHVKRAKLLQTEWVLFSSLLLILSALTPGVCAVLFVTLHMPLFAFFTFSGSVIVFVGGVLAATFIGSLIRGAMESRPIKGFFSGILCMLAVAFVMGICASVPVILSVYGGYKAVMLGSHGWAVALFVLSAVGLGVAVLGLALRTVFSAMLSHEAQGLEDMLIQDNHSNPVTINMWRGRAIFALQPDAGLEDVLLVGELLRTYLS